MNTVVKSVESYWRALMKENCNYLDVKLKIHNIAISKKKAAKTYHVFFENKRLAFIHHNFILHQNAIINCLPESLQDDEIPSTVYSFSNTIRNKCFNQEDNVNNINTDNTSNYGNGVSSCNCASCKSLSRHHGHIITGYLLIIKGKKSCKIIS